MGEGNRRRAWDAQQITDGERQEILTEIDAIESEIAKKPEVRSMQVTVKTIDGDAAGAITLDLDGNAFTLPAPTWREWSKSPDEPLGYIVPQIGMKVVMTGMSTGGVRRFKITRP